MLKIVLDTVENVEGKGENAGSQELLKPVLLGKGLTFYYQACPKFLLFPPRFQNPSFLGS